MIGWKMRGHVRVITSWGSCNQPITTLGFTLYEAGPASGVPRGETKKSMTY